ncbi:MAG TPA: sigma factor-like helix-turn-helix DNA-binding protein [Candidatus Paceibacterota bacterium]|nr:sigma factor-like helix-turn-helix DNA-binding protein [Candidatus Paceibacterota bacterium]
MAKEALDFKTKDVVKKLLTALPERARDVLVKRYGLDKSAKRMTLEAIGEEYGITRERVRQIENFGLGLIKKSESYTAASSAFNELKKLMEGHGGIVHEQEFLETITKDALTQNQIHFLLVLSDSFLKLKEDDEFHHRWTTNNDLAERVHASLRNLCSNFTDNDLVSESELIGQFLSELKEVVKDSKTKEFARRWIAISKTISPNPLGEWGLVKSPNVKMRGIRDFAFLVLRQHGSPMHFSEVAKSISKLFGKKAHPATCHNELIKDKRFVLVGRGLYALTEWGYSRGVVRDVIHAILKTDGPLTREEIVAKVLKERHVKENTIVVNLQNTAYFKRDKAGRYMAV